MRNSLIFKIGNRRILGGLGYKGPYSFKEHYDSKSKYTEDDIINMLVFLIKNINVHGLRRVGEVFHQIVGIPMGNNCAPLLVDIFL